MAIRVVITGASSGLGAALARHYLKRTNPSDPYASPAFASFKDFPPIMVHAGSLEMLRDDALRLGDRPHK